MKNGFAVSICMITYNHESYIKQAIEGVLMQKTNFDFELVIGEDCSTDHTRQICEDYAALHSQINLLHTEANLGVMPNFFRTLEACQGKYIALCEGDDYWIDPLKLQKQVDFLEEHKDYGLIYSKVKVFDQKKNRFLINTKGKDVTSIEELLIYNYIPTPTVMFRLGAHFDYIDQIKPYDKKWLMGDYPFWLYIASVTKIKYMNYPTSVYRILENSAAHLTEFSKEILFTESYYAIKLFFINRLNYSHLRINIFENLFISKAYIYIYKNENNISDLIREINSFEDKSIKLKHLKFLLNNWIFRKLLKLYWKIKSD